MAIRVTVEGMDCLLTGTIHVALIQDRSRQERVALVGEGAVPSEVGAFSQVVPEVIPGRYAILWYDPQTGRFSEKTVEAEVKDDRMLLLSVPSFSRDLACVVLRHR